LEFFYDRVLDRGDSTAVAGDWYEGLVGEQIPLPPLAKGATGLGMTGQGEGKKRRLEARATKWVGAGR